MSVAEEMSGPNGLCALGRGDSVEGAEHERESDATRMRSGRVLAAPIPLAFLVLVLSRPPVVVCASNLGGPAHILFGVVQFP